MSKRYVFANPARKPTPVHADYTGEFLGPTAVLGLIALVVQPWLISLRAGEVAQSLILTNIVDRHFATLTAFGTRYELGTCAVTGFAMTLAQMISASVFLVESGEDAKRRVLKFLSASGWLLATVLELFLSCANNPREQAVAFVLALTLTVLETASGILIIDCLIVPAVLSIGWTIRDAFNRRNPRP
jgi:hypothetical protein